MTEHKPEEGADPKPEVEPEVVKDLDLDEATNEQVRGGWLTGKSHGPAAGQ